VSVLAVAVLDKLDLEVFEIVLCARSGIGERSPTLGERMVERIYVRDLDGCFIRHKCHPAPLLVRLWLNG
jgi:hypothetical protein